MTNMHLRFLGVRMQLLIIANYVENAEGNYAASYPYDTAYTRQVEMHSWIA